MVKYILRMKVDLENIEEVQFPPDYVWNIDVVQSLSCEERKGVTLCALEEAEIPNSRGKANLIIKFEGSKHPGTINIEQLKNVTRPYTAQDSGNFVPIVAFECRGVEPTKWTPTAGCSVRGPRALFRDVDIAEDWAEFDEAANKTVGIYGLEYEFALHKI